MVLDAALRNTQHYKVGINSKVEQTRERSSTLLYTLVLLLLKREPSGCPWVQSPTYFYNWCNLLDSDIVVSVFKLQLQSCPWCNGYRRRKWTRRFEFKSWTRMIAFHIALLPLGKVWIQLFSLQLWVNSRTD